MSITHRRGSSGGETKKMYKIKEKGQHASNKEAYIFKALDPRERES